METKFLSQHIQMGEFAIGFSIGAPPPPYYRGYYARPPLPGPGYAWIDGSWCVEGGRYAWRNGYWGRPPYAGAYWVAPRYYGGRYFNASTARDLEVASRVLDETEKGLLVSRPFVRDAPVYEWFALPALFALAAAVALRAIPFFIDQT